jgi:hypothetical protein
MNPFLHPMPAWSAAGLASIPIIIHLLNRRRLRRIDWAAMEFLLAALRRNKRRIRIEQLILLLCRIALMVLLAFFIARPLLDASRFGWLAGALQSEERVFVLDDSLSMSQRIADRTLFARAATALEDSVSRVAEQSSRDRLTILATSRANAPLLQKAFVDRDRATAVSQAIRAAEPTSARAKLGDVLSRIAEQSASASDAASSSAPRVISILTDLRASDWTDGQGGPDATLRTALEDLTKREDVPTRVVVLDIGQDSPTTNVLVRSIQILSGRPTVGVPATVRVDLSNTGSLPASDVRVRVSYASSREDAKSASMAIAPTVASLAAGATESVSISCSFRVPGQYWLEAEVSAATDSLPADNRLAVVFDVVEAVEVLVVNGEPSSERWEGETDFLASALEPSGEARSGVSPTIVVEDGLPSGDLSKYASIFIANAYRLDEDFLRRLGAYIRSGGSLFLFLGDQVDAAVYERDLGLSAGPPDEKHPARGLLPAKLGEIISFDNVPVAMTAVTSHPYMDPLRGGGESYLQEIGFRRFFDLVPHPTAQVLARFADGEDHPAIVEMGVDAGRVVLFATTADSEWHDWPKNPTYFILMHQILGHVGHRPPEEPPHSAGTVVQFPIDITRFDPRGTLLRGPEYPKTPERQLIASARSDDPTAFELRIDDTQRAGLSFLTLKGSGSETDRVLAVSVRSEPDESELSRVSAEQLARLYPGLPISVVEDAERFSETGRGRFEASDVLLGAFIVLLLIEGFLAWIFAHHRRGSSGAESVPLPFSPTTSPTTRS